MVAVHLGKSNFPEYYTIDLEQFAHLSDTHDIPVQPAGTYGAYSPKRIYLVKCHDDHLVQGRPNTRTVEGRIENAKTKHEKKKNHGDISFLERVVDTESMP